MNQVIWPVSINGDQFEEPQFNPNSKKYQINGTNLVDMVMDNNKLWNYLNTNKSLLSAHLSQYMDNISDPFVQIIPNKALARIKLPATEWQQERHHQYAVMELTHCSNYNNCLLPFHDAQNQYAFFFVDIDNTVKTGDLQLYWKEDQISDGTYEEHIWTCPENVDIIYAPETDHDEKDAQIGLLKMMVQYLKGVANDRLDEIEQSADDVFTILLVRLRGKIRNGKHGRILAVNAILSDSQKDTIEDSICNVADEDEEFKSSQNARSYKLTRSRLFGNLQINPEFILKIFDENTKEMKLHQSFKNVELYDDSSDGYNSSRKSLLETMSVKFKDQERTPKSLYGFNGMRVTFTGNKIKLTTNDFKSTIQIDQIDQVDNTQQYRIAEELGRRSGW